MPLNKLQNFIKNTEGRILYVNPNDIDSTDSITNTGNSLAQPFKTIQRALLESARFSFISGKGNDIVEKTTILVFPAEHLIDNRPGYAIYDNGGVAYAVPPSGGLGSPAQPILSLELDSNFDLTQDDNILYKFNSINGGVIIPRGTSIVGLDLRKTKVRPKYVPNPTDPLIKKSSIFRVTGACYFWQFSFFDGDETGLVYTHPSFFSDEYKSTPKFSHHKLTCFEYADGVNEVGTYGLTDLDMYYSKLSNAFNNYREIPITEKFPNSTDNFAKRDPEWQIVGAFATDPVSISNIISGNGTTASNLITVTTEEEHNFNSGTPIKVRGVGEDNYNISTKVQNIIDRFTFTYLLESFPINLDANPPSSGATVTIETDTVSGASPYIFNCSLRSVWGMNGMHADGNKASGFRSMVVAQFTAVSLQKDDRAFVKYDPVSRSYIGVNYDTVYGSQLSAQSSQTDTTKIYHLDQDAIYRKDWETSHIKISNDAFIQVVSVFAIGFNKHFDIESGGDASITNSNSNFGQISLNSDGYKAEAFDKDNNGYITSIICPREIDTSVEEDIEWLSLDVAKIVSEEDPTKLYLFGLDKEDSLPINIIQGYRIGARENDKLYINIDGVEYSGVIHMEDGPNGISPSSYKSYNISSVSNSILNVSSGHNIATGEKIIINSETGDLPENITPHIVYYAIRVSGSELKLATSLTNALNGESVTIYGGESLVVKSRVSDKASGDIGSPIQWDSSQNNWYVTVNSSNTIYSAIVNNQAELEGNTDLSYVKRIVDERSLDEKLYKVRVVIPKEQSGAKDPENGFIIQESSKTGARDGDFTITSIDQNDYDFKRNYRFITKAEAVNDIITIETSLPHSINVGDTVVIRNITCSSNPEGIFGKGYNGKFEVTGIDEFSFTYKNIDIFDVQHFTGTESTNDIHQRLTADQVRSLPRYERSDLQSNLYIYRNEVISPYIENVQDGIYHLYVLNSSNAISEEFTNLKYSQSTVDLYPQLDRDNILSNPRSAKTFALRAPIGDICTSDLKKSITRETIDKFSTSFGIGKKISSVSSNSNSITITFSREHGLNGITNGTLSGNSGYIPGTYYDVKLLNGNANPLVGTWKGARAKVVVDSGTNISSVEILHGGSAYSSGEVLYFDYTDIGIPSSQATYTITANGILDSTNDVVQITGDGTLEDSYFRIINVPSKNQITVAKGPLDIDPTTTQYALLISPAVQVQSKSFNASLGILTINCNKPHGLLSGNKITLRNDSEDVVGDYIVEAKINQNSFTIVSEDIADLVDGFVLKHGYSSNFGISDIREENLATRQITLYASDKLVLSSTIGNADSDNTVSISEYYSGDGVNNRFSMGTYIQIDNEIMRIISSANINQFTVIRGSLGTRKEIHQSGSLIKKINQVPIEFRRPSILRASGHTFEYLGYGPGNYSTSLPQVQFRSLSERESFLVQSQERSGGTVVYTGMNNDGDFFSGNTKTSSSSGEIISYDIPRPTVTGEDPSKSSAVFDELTVKERILVEGGDSGTVLSQFDGPVTFNKNTRFKSSAIFSDNIRIKKETGISLESAGNVYFKKDLSVDGDIISNGGLDINGDLSLKDDKKISLGNDLDLQIYHSSSGTSYIENASSSEFILKTDDFKLVDSTGTRNILNGAEDGSVKLYFNNSLRLETNNDGINLIGNLDLTNSPASSGRISANFLDVPNVSPIGSIVLWAGGLSNFPDNWKICNGEALLISEYLECYNILTNNGTSFPYGTNIEGNTKFKLPNITDRFVVGTGNLYSIGSTGGSRDTVLVKHKHDGTTSENNVAHNHTGTTGDQSVDHIHSGTTGDDSPDHTHNVDNIPTSDVEFGNRTQAASSDTKTTVTSSGASTRHQHPFTTGSNNVDHTHGFTTNDSVTNHTHEYETSEEGVVGTDKNLPPYFGLIYLIRVL